MRSRRLEVASILAATSLLWAGCGGGDAKEPSPSPAASDSAAAGAPEPREPLADAAQRLVRAVAQQKCQPLAQLTILSITLGPDATPDTPLTQEQCRRLLKAAPGQYEGLEIGRAHEFGPAGITEDSRIREGVRKAVDDVWLLDTDGSWRRAAYLVLADRSGPDPPDSGYDAFARSFVQAVHARDCRAMWVRLSPFSRFVSSVGGDRERFCESIALTFKSGEGGLADLADDAEAQPRRLGILHGSAVYGVSLRNGRYLEMVVSRTTDDADPGHTDPAVFELVSSRLPSGA